jgi:replicative DNA helicase
MNPEEFMGDLRLVSTLEKITGLPLFIDDTGPWTSETVPQKIRKLYYEYQCNVIYVDYIGLIMGAGALGSAPKNQQLTAISAGLKGLASELSIPILAASQLNRDVERRADNRPFLADLRDSGSLEQDASIVAFLYPNVSREAHPDSNPTLFESITELPVTFEIAKQRNGPVNSFDLMLYKKYGIFMSKDDVNATY